MFVRVWWFVELPVTSVNEGRSAEHSAPAKERPGLSYHEHAKLELDFSED